MLIDLEIDKELSLELFSELLRIRMIENAIGNRYAEQKMRCPVHLSIGQEAIAVGVCKTMAPEDFLMSNHRAHAHYLARGGDLKKMIAEIYGKVTGCTSGKGGSMHLIDLTKNIIGTTPIVGGSFPVGIGIAFSSFLKEENNVTVLFFGEGATEEGIWAEGINFASLKNLPVLFVCENNFYSVYSPMEVRQSEKRSRLDIVEAHGIKTYSGQGNSVEEVYEKSQQAMKHIRQGKGPAFLEFTTYRYREHCGPNLDPKGYRPQDEVEYWFGECPVEKYQKTLLERGHLTQEDLLALEKHFQKEIDEAFTFAEESPFPKYREDDPIYDEELLCYD